MKFELNEYTQTLRDEDILNDILDVSKKLSASYISISTYKIHGKYSQSAIQGHFGTWKNALRLAGLRSERDNNELKLIKNNDYREDLIRVAKICNKNTVTYSDYKEHGKYSAEHLFKRFNSWDDALQFAGLAPTGLARKKISKQDLFENIEEVWIMLGKQPTSTDIIKSGFSKYSIDTYKKRFGSWRKALESFVEWVNKRDEACADNTPSINTYTRNNLQPHKNMCIKNESEIDGIANPTNQHFISHKTPRNINLRLRFKVMQRDNFTCVICGASPAKDPNVQLHIDHIIPWSKGGETELNNLQTLCSKCNFGKSDLDM